MLDNGVRSITASPLIVVLIIASMAAPATLHAKGPWESILSLAADPVDPDVMYACSGTRGLFISRDAGRTWTQAKGLPARLIAVAVDPATPGTVYVAAANGSFRSDDRGRKWTALPPHDSDPPMPIGDVAVNNGHVVLEASLAGLRRSTDRGGSWKQVGGVPGAFGEMVRFDLGNPRLAYAALLRPDFSALVVKESPVLASNDAGLTWKTIHRGVVDDLLVAGRILLATRVEGVLVSDDRGATWEQLPAPPRTYKLAIDPANHKVFYAAASDRFNAVYRSTDAGQSWKEMFRFAATVEKMVRTPRGLYVAAGDRLLLSNDEGEYEIIGREITEALRSTSALSSRASRSLQRQEG